MEGRKKKTKPKAEAAQDNNPSRISLFFYLAISLLTFIAYYQSLSNDWTDWDDGVYVLDNELVKDFDAVAILSSYVAGNYHPVTMIFLATEYQVFGREPSGYHVVSLLLHIINSLLVFYFVSLLIRNNVGGFIAALLFAIHPLHVESVSWISAQKDLLYCLFYFLALIVYLKYSRDEKKDWRKYVLLIVFFIASLLSKAQAVTLPVIMVLTDWFQTKKISFRQQLDKIPFFIIAIISGIVAILAQQQSSAIQDMSYFRWSERLLFANYAIVRYLGKLIWPLNLSTYYPYPTPINERYPLLVYISPLIVIVVALLVFYTRKKNSVIVFGSLFFLINIFLILQLLPVGGAIIADRYSYLSFTGWFIIIGWMAALSWKQRSSKTLFPIIILVIIGAWLPFLFVETKARTSVWQNSGTLFTNVISQYDNVEIVYNNLGWYYMQTGKLQLAKVNFDRAIDLHPGFVNGLINRYAVLKKLGKDDSALVDARLLIQLKPDLPEPYLDRGVAYGVAGKTDSALMDFRTVARLSPDLADVHVNMGNIYFMKEMYDSALVQYHLALKKNRSITGVYNPLGFTYLETGNYTEAENAFNKAIAEDSIDPNNYYGRMKTYEKLGQFGKAYEDAVKSVQLGAEIPEDYLQQLKSKGN